MIAAAGRAGERQMSWAARVTFEIWSPEFGVAASGFPIRKLVSAVSLERGRTGGDGAMRHRGHACRCLLRRHEIGGNPRDPLRRGGESVDRADQRQRRWRAE